MSTTYDNTRALQYGLRTNFTDGWTDVIYAVYASVADADNGESEPIAEGTHRLHHDDSDEIRAQLLTACVASLEEQHGAKYLPPFEERHRLMDEDEADALIARSRPHTTAG